jgi:hypothetical protein
LLRAVASVFYVIPLVIFGVCLLAMLLCVASLLAGLFGA